MSKVQEMIEATWRLAKEKPPKHIERELASPHREYRMAPRVCTVCGSEEIVKDGTYLCREHHP